MPPANSINISAFRLLRTSLLHQIREFFTLSTLHGVRFIAERGRPAWEGFCWFCVVAASFVTTLIIILNLWDKFQTNPTITGPDTGSRVNRTHFPTVGICPHEPFDPDRVLRFAKSVSNSSDEDQVKKLMDVTELLSQVSYNRMKETDVALRGKPKKLLSLVGDLRQNLFNVAIGCNETVKNCWFRNKPLECCEHFKLIFSERGLCFAFNARFFDTPKRW
ncbi:uncharacterized protein LOC131676158 [Topomyia yanbarensis]|uniref:uncharacterized protein LOC131676158 n=1 Tax=Topomyia yanbarensis TaxID=2498891 RepID=UPI00273AE3F2|nr:uncharacterized protein LOC131676158 [Topomyia yanbarensis]